VGDDAIIFNEYPLRPDHCAREKAGTFFALGPAGGLGWGFGAALGAKLASPDAFVVATLGDGAYMFSNPTVGHWVSAKHELPILTIVYNNSRYGAVRRATLSMFKDAVAGENDGRLLADLDPAPPYDEIARAQGAYAERVEKPSDLPDALKRAREAVVDGRRQALLNVITPY
jgi:acetolactate synthase-1/2/3 large subunit